MKRAAVLIGVNRTGELPELAAASRSAARMRDWAGEQGMDTELIIDSAGPVEPGRIRDAVDSFINAPVPYEQLLVYFAGHGVNLRYSEYWLLSKAPKDTQAAVNVLGSATLARYCGIEHVVFISDACRTAADSVRAQFVTGSEIFPNEGRTDEERPVDLFYACTLGRPAYEVRSAEDAARVFCAVYTSALLNALDGRVAAAVDWEPEAPRRGHVRMRKLKRALSEQVPSLLSDAKVPAHVFQQPDAHIASDDAAWLAELPAAANPVKTCRGSGPRPPPAERPPAPDPLAEAFAWLLRPGAEPGVGWHAAGAGERARAGVSEAAAQLLAQADGIAHPERLLKADAADAAGTAAEGSFLVIGTPVAQVWTPGTPFAQSQDGIVQLLAPGRQLVLFQFGGGRLALLPAFPGYRATLTVDVAGDLVDVAYEGRAGAAEPARQLRSLAAVASLGGRFHLDDAQLAQLSASAQGPGPVDPALALYAAYADVGQGRRARAAHWDAAMRRDAGATWLDLVLLASEPRHAAQASVDAPLALPFPMRVTGWATLDALGIRLAPALEPLRAALAGSPWTVFEQAAAPVLLEWMARFGHGAAPRAPGSTGVNSTGVNSTGVNSTGVQGS